jgi:AcrR family transcriptional regulator
MPDIMRKSGLSVGAIYRYFTSKDEIIRAICAEGTQSLPSELTASAIRTFLDSMQALSKRNGHARLVAQIYAEAALSDDLATLVRGQLDELQARIADLLTGSDAEDARRISGTFVALCQGYSQQMAVQLDVNIDDAVAALLEVIRS